jgi:hypothetical protein
MLLAAARREAVIPGAPLQRRQHPRAVPTGRLHSLPTPVRTARTRRGMHVDALPTARSSLNPVPDARAPAWERLSRA